MPKPPRKGPNRANKLSRHSSGREVSKTLSVFCEGEKTESTYLAALKEASIIHGMKRVRIKIYAKNSRSNPLSLVTAAVGAKEKAAVEGREIDEFWCIFDVEWPINHPNLQEAIALAKSEGIHTAISNPCFELWLILHFQDQTSWLATKDAVRVINRHVQNYDKGVKADHFMPRLLLAQDRAKYLDVLHKQQGKRFPRNNPSSGMNKFIDSVR